MTHAIDAAGPFYHGTRAQLAVGDLLSPGFTSNYADRKLSWIYFSGTLDAAIWGCELARGREGQDACERIPSSNQPAHSRVNRSAWHP